MLGPGSITSPAVASSDAPVSALRRSRPSRIRRSLTTSAKPVRLASSAARRSPIRSASLQLYVGDPAENRNERSAALVSVNDFPSHLAGAERVRRYDENYCLTPFDRLAGLYEVGESWNTVHLVAPGAESCLFQAEGDGKRATSASSST